VLSQPVWPRGIVGRLQESLADTPVVLLNGPRQSGKTTLVRQFASEQRPYLTLDDVTTCSAAREDPQGFIRRLDGAVIDEVQRVPELLLAIKLAVDERCRPGRFLLTGSADVMALPRVADSLAGRVEVLSLLPLAGCELAGQPSAWIDALFAALAAETTPPSPPPDQAAAQVGEALEERVLTGGYPEALHRSSERRRQAWARSYLNAILQRDVREIAGTFKAAGVVSPAEGDQCHIEQAYPEGMRKAKDVPYISHLIAVSALAWEDARRDPGMWSRFNAGLDGTAWYLHSLHEIFRQRLENSRSEELLGESLRETGTDPVVFAEGYPQRHGVDVRRRLDRLERLRS
jgi:hypothetical protein